LGQLPVSSLPLGSYSLYLLVTPAGNRNSYYLWSTTAKTGDNVIPISVNGPLCTSGSYPNKPCVSVKVCTPNTDTCQVIDDILLDTGSVGLRIFKQPLDVALAPVSVSAGVLAECLQFADGSANWGFVAMADVMIGNEPAVQVPVQVIDADFGTLPGTCVGAEQSPQEAGFNGILGLGLFNEDCGSICASLASNGMYYACSGSGCTATAVALAKQIKNPIAFLPEDNNGLMIELPAIVSDGFPSAGGYIVLGIGTQSNNIPSSVATYATDELGDLYTTFNGIVYSSFIDTGSNGLFFPAGYGMLQLCAWPNAGWYCPSSAKNFTAINMGVFGSTSGSVSFQIGNYADLINSPNFVFSDIGGTEVGDFDWGLPFFFGKKVFMGLEGTSSILGTGPYWAY
ncbi:MAG TPA: DUF3443 domain-containing protein, partial [Saprospiraceae bacterium]|nr:DUF3443 domain-containing protein [Saprospiraceae bacterium]